MTVFLLFFGQSGMLYVHMGAKWKIWRFCNYGIFGDKNHRRRARNRSPQRAPAGSEGRGLKRLKNQRRGAENWPIGETGWDGARRERIRCDPIRDQKVRSKSGSEKRYDPNQDLKNMWSKWGRKISVRSKWDPFLRHSHSIEHRTISSVFCVVRVYPSLLLYILCSRESVFWCYLMIFITGFDKY